MYNADTMRAMRALRAIQNRDPDGGSKKPTKKDYREFESWARHTFGQKIWDIYRKGNWAERSDV